MYAIIESGGKQYKVQPGQIIEVETLGPEEGLVAFDRVLMYADGDAVRIGSPVLAEVKVTGEVLGVIKGPKLVAFKKRRRKDSQRTRGHRQALARVRIDEISVK